MQKNKKPYGLIYKGTDPINGKIYIGQTINLEKRIIQHAKNGRINFQWDILCEVNSKKELEEKEKYYIDKYDSMNPEKGYNRKYGSGSMSREVLDEISINYHSKCNYQYLSKDHNFTYSLNIKSIISRYYSYDWVDIGKIELCLLNIFVYFLAKKYHAISNKTLLLHRNDIIKKAPYLRNADLYTAFYNLISTEIIKLKRNKYNSNNEYCCDISNPINQKIAFTFCPKGIKKFTVVKRINFDAEKEIYYA